MYNQMLQRSAYCFSNVYRALVVSVLVCCLHSKNASQKQVEAYRLLRNSIFQAFF